MTPLAPAGVALGPAQLCAGRGDTDTCQGDSGGGLVADNLAGGSGSSQSYSLASIGKPSPQKISFYLEKVQSPKVTAIMPDGTDFA